MAPVKKRKPMELQIQCYNVMVEEMDEVSTKVLMLRAQTDRAFSQWYALKRDLEKYAISAKKNRTNEEVQQFNKNLFEYNEQHFYKKDKTSSA